jgi:A/G-specific adenine glycosylase
MGEIRLSAEFANSLIAWFNGAARDLPWRKPAEGGIYRDPYRVWVSEIMLQQTRVAQVIGYFERFMQKFPTALALAAADEDTLLKAWEGLGYYSRARNLHKAASIVARDYGGKFPDSYESVRALPGIGDYTAGTVCALCFNLPRPSVDGNVLRVVARAAGSFLDIAEVKTRKTVTDALTPLYEKTENRGMLTESIMELGALVCVPNGTPKCGMCPIAGLCEAKKQNLTDKLPVKSPKKPRKIEKLTVFTVESDGLYAFLKRAKTGLLAGLYEFPNYPEFLDERQAAEALNAAGFTDYEFLSMRRDTHIFTHREWHMHVYHIKSATRPKGFFWLPPDSAALPTAFKKLLVP